MTRKKRDLHELVHEHGIPLALIARLLKTTYHSVLQGDLACGMATPQQRKRLAEIMGIEERAVDAALAESASRAKKREAG